MFRILFAILVTTVCIFIANALIPQKIAGRINGGNDVSIEDYPYQVAILYNNEYLCSGVIFNDVAIITAAANLQGRRSESLKVRAGSAKWNEGGTLFNVKSFVLHKNFNKETLENNVALIQLASEIIPSKTIFDITLVSEAPSDDTEAVVAGWGQDQREQPTANPVLRAVSLKIMNRTNCAQRYGYYGSIYSTMICGVGLEKGGCAGDDGAPLVEKGNLIGIFSHQQQCGNKQYPGIYTSVADVKSWIESTAGSWLAPRLFPNNLACDY